MVERESDRKLTSSYERALPVLLAGILALGSGDPFYGPVTWLVSQNPSCSQTTGSVPPNLMGEVAWSGKKETSQEFWAKIFPQVDPLQMAVIRAREGATLSDRDGIYQVSREYREENCQRIPLDFLKLIARNDSISKKAYSPEQLEKFLATEKNQKEFARRLSLDPAFYNQSEFIQTFWGWWYFQKNCVEYGTYLSYLRYNHPSAVFLTEGNYGIVNQIMAVLGDKGVDKKDAIFIGNQLIESIDDFKNGRKPVLKLEECWWQPGLYFEKGRSRFYWGGEVKGKVFINGREVPFHLRGAHYLWSISQLVNPTDREAMRNYGERALEYAYTVCGFSARTRKGQEERTNLRRKLFDLRGNPIGILASGPQSEGAIDLLEKMSLPIQTSRKSDR